MKNKYYLKMKCIINGNVEELWYTGIDVILNKDIKYAHGYGFKFLAENTAEVLIENSIFIGYKIITKLEVK